MKNYKSVVMAKKILIVLFSLFCVNTAFAGLCDEYKNRAEIKIQKSKWNVTVQPSDKDLSHEAGYVNVQPYNSVVPGVSYSFNGKFFCVYLTSIEATVGFKDFEIIIDKKYEKDSCEYNAVLAHEKHHIKDAEDALENVFPDIEGALQEAVDSVEPIYTEDVYEVPYAIEKINNQVIKYHKLQELVERFKKQHTESAKTLDDSPDENMKKCLEDKLKDAFDKYYEENPDKLPQKIDM